MKDDTFKLADRFADAGPGLGAWIREKLAPASLLAGLRTLIWLAPLTIAVWYYAARSISITERVTMTITLLAADESRVVQLQNEADGLITVQITGTAAVIEPIADSLNNRELKLRVDGLDADGPQTRNLEELLKTTEAFKNLPIEDVTPRTIGIIVDTVVERQIPVRMPPAVQEKFLDSEGTLFDPSTVTIHAPSAALAQAEAENRLFAEADLSLDSPLFKTSGRKEGVPVVLRSPLPSPAKIEPRQATATLQVKTADVPLVLDSIAVFASLPPYIANEYRVTLTPTTIPNVRVLGPPDVIELLRQNQVKPPPVARVDFSPDDQGQLGRPIQKRVAVMLPDGVRLDPSAGPLFVEMTLERRDNR